MHVANRRPVASAASVIGCTTRPVLDLNMASVVVNSWIRSNIRLHIFLAKWLFSVYELIKLMSFSTAQRSESSYSRLTSQKPTGTHDIIKLQCTKHEVHTASCNAAVVDCKASYGLSDRRGWQDGAVDCCLPSIGYDYWRKYWANTNTTQYRQVLANTQYSNTDIVRTLVASCPAK